MTEFAPAPRKVTDDPRRPERELLPAASLTAIAIRPSRARSVEQPVTTTSTLAAADNRTSGRALPRDGDPAVLAAWWAALKGAHDIASRDDIDTEAIGAAWPEAVVLGYDPQQEAITGATRLSGVKANEESAIEYSPMMTEWLLALGRKAAKRRMVVHETRAFPVGRGLASYRIVALPFGSGRHGVDTILCHLASA